MTQAFVLLSGGIDSTTCLAIAAHKWGAWNCHTFSVDYGQRHRKEIDCAKAVARYYGASHKILRFPGMPNTMLTDPNQEVPSVDYKDIVGISPTYVPFRNGLMLSMLAAQAQAYNKESGDDVVMYFGAHAEDAAGWAYPDCTPEFIGAMQNAIFIGTYQKVRLEVPLTYMGKVEIIIAGSELGAPYSYTWSCYKGEELHCGVCPTCRARRAGFGFAGIDDPTKYADTPVPKDDGIF